MTMKAAAFSLALSFLALDCASASPAPDAPASSASPAPANAPSLYDRLGGLKAIRAVVDEFVSNVAADERINAAFAATDIPAFKQKLVDQICSATGGPCTYTGKDMVKAHKGMHIKDSAFDALVADLKAALDKFQVPPKEQGELLGALGGMRPQIVNDGVAAK